MVDFFQNVLEDLNIFGFVRGSGVPFEGVRDELFGAVRVRLGAFGGGRGEVLGPSWSTLTPQAAS